MPSLRNSSRQTGSRATQFLIESLKSFVSTIVKADNLDSGSTYLWYPPIDRLRIYKTAFSLTGRFMHENRSIKTELMAFLSTFYRFFNMLLWLDPLIVFN